ILIAAGVFGEDTWVPRLLAVDPPKEELREWEDGDPFNRRVLVTLLERSTGVASEVLLSLTEERVLERRELKNNKEPYGQPQFMFDEYEEAAAIVKASSEWQAVMKRRGLEEHMELAFCSPLAPGFFNRDDEVGKRIIRSHTYLRFHEDD